MKKRMQFFIGLIFMMFVMGNSKENVVHAGMREKADRVENEVNCVTIEVDENCARSMIKETLEVSDLEIEGDFWNQMSTFSSPGISLASVPVNETKKVSWKSVKFETGLPGYMWYWSLDVTLQANDDGTGYEYVTSTCSFHTVEQWWKILVMQYKSYSCLLSEYKCYYDEKSDKVNFEASVVYDISYLLQNDIIPTSYSVRGSDTHSILLR